MKHRFQLVIIALAAVSLSCSIFIGGPTALDEPISPTPDALQSLNQDLATALSDSLQDGILRLTLSESQLTAYLASHLNEQTNPQVINPQVVLRDGIMILFGKVRSGIIEANFAVTTRIDIDASGQPVIQIVEADFGPLPMSNILLESVGSLLQEILTGSIGPAATGFRLEAIDVTNGQMTVTGRLR